MYITLVAGSPCESIFCDLRYSTTLLATPAESRKAWASKARFCVDFLLDLMLLEIAIACITSPLNNSFSEDMRTETRLIIGSSLTDTAHFRPARNVPQLHPGCKKRI